LFTTWATLTEGGKTLDLGRWNFPLHDFLIGAIGHVLLLAVGIAGSRLLGGKPLAQELTLWGWRERARAATAAVTTKGTAAASVEARA
jgi:SSS family solute:Na+ symporter